MSTTTPVSVAGNATIHAGHQIGTYDSGTPRYRKLCTTSRNDRHEPMAAPGATITCKRCLTKTSPTQPTTTQEATVSTPKQTSKKSTSKPKAAKVAAEPFTWPQPPKKLFADYLKARVGGTDWHTYLQAQIGPDTPKRAALAALKDLGLVQKVYALPAVDSAPELKGKSFGLYTGPAPTGTKQLPRRVVERKAPAVSAAAKDKAIAQVAGELAENSTLVAAALKDATA